MKSYEEMTDSVLQKARMRRRELRRNRNNLLAALSLCCVVLTVWGINRTTQPINPIIQTLPPATSETAGLPTDAAVSPRLTLLCTVPGSEPGKVMETNVEIPYKAEVLVWDISNLTEAELQEVLAQERAYKELMKGAYPEEISYGRHRRENVVVTTVSVGCFSMVFEDVQSVARIRATVTENGYLMAYPRTEHGSNSANGWFGIDVDGENFRQSLAMKQNRNFEMFWQISPVVADKVNADPVMDLSQIHDTITLTVNYTDGREEITKIKISVNAQGQVSAVRQETWISQ